MDFESIKQFVPFLAASGAVPEQPALKKILETLATSAITGLVVLYGSTARHEEQLQMLRNDQTQLRVEFRTLQTEMTLLHSVDATVKGIDKRLDNIERRAK